MSSTHDPQQPSPFDRLPDELLVKILRHLPQHELSAHSHIEGEHGSMGEVRLVSRRFNAVGRDLAWRGFKLSAAPSKRDLARALEVLGFLPAGQPVSCSELELTGTPREGGLALARWAAEFPDVEGLSVQSCGIHDLENATSFSKLRFLSLGDMDLNLPPSAFFPGVESMDLYCATFGWPLRPITTSAFPALRRLGVDFCRVQGADSDVLPPNLVAQLEYIQLEDLSRDGPAWYRPLGVEIARQEVRILWTVSLVERVSFNRIVVKSGPMPSAAVGRYLRLEPPDMVAPSSSTALDAALGLIAKHAHLRAVFLPSSMWQRAPSADPDEAASRQAIIDHCASFSMYLREEAARAQSAAVRARD
ncbi:uncharacterized protein RHOBADRAFT_46964 [Rhodotorula graminis WP1]|uniref:F-box domain-containing protein n=1 Tax=Rhodotorula graminis (strain WP1) TaxID=578459 RepID=A0A0P9EY56_RHOGW|nr:uncharacterized protein RHOBADRAFT_46964 [Rhodotorula graminis WP1]KPV72124.1 hypothetical protein RHOBADRAFT_46964 [Rhodotorula graminis WP1]